MNTEDINIEKKAENIEEDINQSAIKDDETQSMSENDNNENNQDLNSEAEKLNVVEEELKQLKDNYIRKVAEFENYKKRTLKEKTELILNGSEKTVIAILPILDDFERAISDKSDDPKAIKVVIDGMHVGYIKSGSCAHVKNLLKSGRIQRITADIMGGPYKLLYFDDSEDKYELEKGERGLSIEIHIILKS